MQYFLSTDVIADTIHALAAMQLLSAPPDEPRTPSPLLDPERLGQLHLLIRNAFAETILALFPFVEDAELDDENPSTPPPHQEPIPAEPIPMLKISLRLPASVAGGENFHGVLRRRLELAVAKRVLAAVATTPGERDTALEEGQHADPIITSMLTPPLSPLPRHSY